MLFSPPEERPGTGDGDLLTWVRARLEGLSEHARQFVQAAALVGETFTLHAVARLQAVTTLSLLPALDEAVAASLIRFDQDRLSFRSALALQVIAAGIPASYRNVLRRDVEEVPPTDADNRPDERFGPPDVAVAEREISALLLTYGSLSRSLTAQLGAEAHSALSTMFEDHGGAAGAARISDLISDDERHQRVCILSVLAAERVGAASAIAMTVLSNLELMLPSRQDSASVAADRHLREALRRYSEMEAGAEAARVESQSRGLDRGSPEAPGSSVDQADRSSLRPRVPSAPADDLTEMQHRIACMVAGGMTNQQVARRISRSPHTVNYHLRKIFQKLDVNSRIDLTRRFHGVDDSGPASR